MTTKDFKRKLTAILSADVQGYSRLMGEDEDSTVRTLTAYRALMTSLIQKHRGYVVDTPGDNLLAEFGSVMDAVRCAVEIQEELRIRNADLPENRKMQFRIGINMGDIIEDGDHIYGDGVNIAARVEGLAEGGGICISGTVYDAIRNKLSMSYEFMGEHVVKNIKELVRIYRIKVEPEAESKVVKEKKAGLRKWQLAALSVIAILILGAFAYKFYLVRSTPETLQVPDISEGVKAKKTIAVLPFENLSSDPEQVYFVDGLTEEILNSLAQIPGLNVTGKTSSFTFKGSNKKAPEIANELGVENILEGSVRKAGNNLRITAQLLRGADGFHLWSKTYDRKLDDIFAVQEDIASAVADELKVTLGIETIHRILGGTDNLEAYELYLVSQGQSNSREHTKALESINAAIALAPDFALAWATKARIHGTLITMGPTEYAAEELDSALSAAQKAIELEPALAGIYNAFVGNILLTKGDFVGAGLALRKALELQTDSSSSSNFENLRFYSTVGYLKKNYELSKEMRQTDPLEPSVRTMYMEVSGLLGDMQQAEKEYERGRTLFEGQWGLGDESITFLRLRLGKVVSLEDIVFSDPVCEVAKEYLDSPEEGLEQLLKIYRDDNNLSSAQLMYISCWAAYFGDSELAMDALDRAARIDATGLHFLWYPVMREVRQLPRFKEFVRKIGLVDYWNKFGWPDICHKLDNGDFECD